MQDKLPASLWLCLVLSVASYCYVLKQENKALVKAIDRMNGGYAEFLNKKIHGRYLYEFINPHTVGTFNIKGLSIACANLIHPLPGRHPRTAPNKD